MRSFLKSCVQFYRWFVSPLLVSLWGNQCRFHPSCSEYALEMLNHKNLSLGFVLRKSVVRFLSCQPYSHRGGVDLPPTY